MVNTEMLKDRIKESGMTMTAIARKTGINKATLYNHLKGQGEFTVSEVVSLSDVLSLSTKEKEQIFLSDS